MNRRRKGHSQVSDDDLFYKVMGERIRQHRQKLGLSQGELAGMVGVQEENVSRWERSVRRPTYENVRTLIGVFGLPLEALAPALHEWRYTEN